MCDSDTTAPCGKSGRGMRNKNATSVFWNNFDFLGFHKILHNNEQKARHERHEPSTTMANVHLPSAQQAMFAFLPTIKEDTSTTTEDDDEDNTEINNPTNDEISPGPRLRAYVSALQCSGKANQRINIRDINYTLERLRSAKCDSSSSSLKSDWLPPGCASRRALSDSSARTVSWR